MHRYRSLAVWQRSHDLVLLVLRSTDRSYHPRSRALFDQLRRAALSIEANVVEGYALGTTPLFRRHLRIAIGSAAETESFLRTAGELEFLPQRSLEEMLRPEALSRLYGRGEFEQIDYTIDPIPREHVRHHRHRRQGMSE